MNYRQTWVLHVFLVLFSFVVLGCEKAPPPPPNETELKAFITDAARKILKNKVQQKVEMLPEVEKSVLSSFAPDKESINNIQLFKPISKIDNNGIKIHAYPVTADVKLVNNWLFYADKPYVLITICEGNMSIHTFTNEVGKASYIIPIDNGLTCRQMVND